MYNLNKLYRKWRGEWRLQDVAHPTYLNHYWQASDNFLNRNTPYLISSAIPPSQFLSLRAADSLRLLEGWQGTAASSICGSVTVLTLQEPCTGTHSAPFPGHRAQLRCWKAPSQIEAGVIHSCTQIFYPLKLQNKFLMGLIIFKILIFSSIITIAFGKNQKYTELHMTQTQTRFWVFSSLWITTSLDKTLIFGVLLHL